MSEFISNSANQMLNCTDLYLNFSEFKFTREKTFALILKLFFSYIMEDVTEAVLEKLLVSRSGRKPRVSRKKATARVSEAAEEVKEGTAVSSFLEQGVEEEKELPATQAAADVTITPEDKSVLVTDKRKVMSERRAEQLRLARAVAAERRRARSEMGKKKELKSALYDIIEEVRSEIKNTPVDPKPKRGKASKAANEVKPEKKRMRFKEPVVASDTTSTTTTTSGTTFFSENARHSWLDIPPF
jgi:hypothetical protein